MELFIQEIGTTANSTASQLFVNGKPFCFIIEDGHRDTKVPGETRISPGRRQVIKRTYGRIFENYKKRFGHKFALEVSGVENFTDILLHIGCFVKDTRGCPLVNRGICMGKDGSYYGIDSTGAYLALYAVVAPVLESGQEVWLETSRMEIIDENTPVG